MWFSRIENEPLRNRGDSGSGELAGHARTSSCSCYGSIHTSYNWYYWSGDLLDHCHDVWPCFIIMFLSPRNGWGGRTFDHLQHMAETWSCSWYMVISRFQISIRLVFRVVSLVGIKKENDFLCVSAVEASSVIILLGNNMGISKKRSLWCPCLAISKKMHLST
jgi:hypothetical protein